MDDGLRFAVQSIMARPERISTKKCVSETYAA